MTCTVGVVLYTQDSADMTDRKRVLFFRAVTPTSMSRLTTVQQVAVQVAAQVRMVAWCSLRTLPRQVLALLVQRVWLVWVVYQQLALVEQVAAV